MKLLTINQVVELTGLSRTTIWRQCKAKRFPQARQLGSRKVWYAKEITKHLTNLPKAK